MSLKDSAATVIRINLENLERTVLKPFRGGTYPILDSTDRILVTGTQDGQLRVGKMSGEEPHVLFTHKGSFDSIALSPDGKWIASGGRDGTIRLTPMPDLSKPTPHTLPYDQFVAKLKSFTNLRVVPDSKSSTGWKLDVGKFPGWEKVPEW
jgi:WD40 repeat protein